MIAIQMGNAWAVSCNPGCVGSIAFNGCGYVLLDARCCSAIKLDREMCPVETVRTVRPYTNICYDEQGHCYWASSAASSDLLYRLDACFQETETLKLIGSCKQQPCSISCDPCHGGLWLAFSDSIEHVDTHTGVCKRISTPGRGRMNLGILALCGGYLVSYLQGERQYIEAACPGCGDHTEFCVPEGYRLCAMVLRRVCCEDAVGCVTNEVGLLLVRRGCRQLELMECAVRCCTGVCPPCPAHPPCAPHPPCPPVPPFPPLPPCCGVYEIMHSVALEEAGIAHILNAEGEKLQKAVAESTNIEELLRVNESVRRTITQITLLEGQLYSKLEVISGCCDEPCGDKPCCDKPCCDKPCCDKPCCDKPCCDKPCDAV